MVVGSNLHSVELLVVGGGPGGYSVAERCAARGMQVALVERVALGGTCLNVGCIPSKALLHIADIAGSGAAAKRLGITLSASVDMAKAQAWMQTVIVRLQGGVSSKLSKHNVDVVHGTLRFEGPQRAIVTGDMSPQRIEFERVVVASGSRPVELPGLPIDGTFIMDSAGALALTKLPKSMVVVGAGYIGVEIGTAFSKLGVKVTIIEAADRILPSIAEPLARPVARQLTQLGVKMILSASVGDRVDGGIVVLRDEKKTIVRADIVLSAVGRRPNTEELGLEHLGVHLEPTGHIRVDAQRRAAPHVYAIGDVTDGPALAHKAIAEADVVAKALHGIGARFEPLCIPEVVFSDPEIVSVGMSATQASGRGFDAESSRRPLSASGRALTLDRTDGFMELVYNKADRSILGIHIVGPGVAELAGEAALAIEMAATIDDLALTIHPHPTLSEELPELAMSAISKFGKRASELEGA